MKPTRILAGSTSAFVYCLVSAVRLAAQDDPFPKEPLIARAPDKSAWTITYRNKQAETEPKPDADPKQKPPDQIVSVQIQKTGKTYHRVTTWASGARLDAWSVGQKQVVKGKGENTYVLMPNDGPATDDYSKSDFEDLAWIGMKDYTGLKKGEQAVFVFRAKNSERPLTRREKYSLVLMTLPRATPTGTKAPSGSPSASPGSTDTKTALEQIFGDSVATVVLDAKTQLPLGYDDGKTVAAYQFTTPPSADLVPPPEVANILRRFDDYTKRTTIRPSAP